MYSTIYEIDSPQSQTNYTKQNKIDRNEFKVYVTPERDTLGLNSHQDNNKLSTLTILESPNITIESARENQELIIFPQISSNSPVHPNQANLVKINSTHKNNSHFNGLNQLPRIDDISNQKNLEVLQHIQSTTKDETTNLQQQLLQQNLLIMQIQMQNLQTMQQTILSNLAITPRTPQRQNNYNQAVHLFENNENILYGQIPQIQINMSP